MTANESHRIKQVMPCIGGMEGGGGDSHIHTVAVPHSEGVVVVEIHIPVMWAAPGSGIRATMRATSVGTENMVGCMGGVSVVLGTAVMSRNVEDCGLVPGV
jgi:hypothetical protein